ncbi:hypothetical protein SDC9_196951 [bioreactor metagenome]|uniref:Uncharacterized protein n=1 Tax=bioreactor metagenome TaxID=1076179 RepID=A0A645IQ13_9ZZZZ
MKTQKFEIGSKQFKAPFLFRGSDTGQRRKVFFFHFRITWFAYIFQVIHRKMIADLSFAGSDIVPHGFFGKFVNLPDVWCGLFPISACQELIH